MNTLLLNGETVPVDGFPVHTTLLDFVRAQGLTGAKEGCAEGECGSCTVAMVAAEGRGSAYRAVNSCLMLLPSAVGREFLTVEALAERGELADVQRAMAAAGGSQCGYCTPGFVMSLFAEQYRPRRTGACDPYALSGNLCRCTGYRPIRDAALAVGPAPHGPLLRRLADPAPRLRPVLQEHAGLRFDRPESFREALSLASQNPQAKWVCGATDLAVESNLRFRRWPHLISVEGIPELQEFSDSPDHVRIGAALPLQDLERLWTGSPGTVRNWLRSFASPPIRNRATLGGSLATASPIGDAAPLLLALDASVHLSSSTGDRTVLLSSFFTGYRQTLLQPGELIRSIQVPKPFPQFVRYFKVSKRRADDISTVAAGFSLDWDSAFRVSCARFAFGGVAEQPLRMAAAEQAAWGQPWDESTVQQIGRTLEHGLQPISDHRGSAAYRLALAKSLVGKFYWEWREDQP